MIGQMMNYNKYFDSLQKMEEPIVPKAKIDMRGFLEYAKKKGVAPAQISKKEKDMFITYIN